MLLPALLLGAFVLAPGIASARNISPGQDFFETQGGSYQDFSNDPIPAGFFYPSSAPFSNRVLLGGRPLGPLSSADTVIRRSAEARFSGPLPAIDTVPIELVQLSLVSIAPIMVSDPNGVTFWDVRIDLPQLYGPQPQGSMIITKTHPNGGIFTSTFAIQPLLTFTDVGGQGVRVLDCTSPPSGYTCPTIELRAENVPWTHKVPRALYESRGFCPSCGPNGERLQMIMTYHDQGVDRSLMSYLPALRM